jgi:putative hydrolase of the HAD superfamily
VVYRAVPTSIGLEDESKTEKKGRQASALFVPLTNAMNSIVTFDAAGTLIHLSEPPGKTYADVARHFGYDFDPARLEAGFRAAWKSLGSRVESEGPRPDDDRGWWLEVVTRALTLGGYSIQPMDEYFDRLYRAFALPGAWKLFPEVDEVLGTLQSRSVRLGLISNFDRRLYEVLEHLGIRDRFEYIVISSEVGSDKPAPRIFLEAARRFGVDPEQILHVGDDPERDGAGATAVGMTMILVDHRKLGLRQVLDLMRFEAG